MKRGFVDSESDRLSEYPASNPHSPGDLAAMIFSSLRLNPHTHTHTATEDHFRCGWRAD